MVVAPTPEREATGAADAETPGERLRLLRALLAEGVPASALARALRTATGLARGEAYDLVQRLKDGEPG